MRPSHLTNIFTGALGLLLSLALASCHKATNARMTVRSVEPRGGSTDVARDAEIRVVFSYRVDMSSINDGTFIVSGSVSGPIAGLFFYLDETRTLTFTPDEPFAVGEEVTVRLTSTIRSTAGTQLSATTFRFAVDDSIEDDNSDPSDGEPVDDDPPDTTPPAAPTVVHRSPEPFARDVEVDRVIEVEFSEFINPFLLPDHAASVCGEVSGPVPVQISGLLETGTTLRLTPLRDFVSGERVTVSVRAGLVGVTGGMFAGDTFSFRVGAAGLVEGDRGSVTATVDGFIQDVRAVDLDGDGRAEIVVLPENSSRIDIWRLSGTAELERALTFDAGEPVLSIGHGDLDSDGDVDLLLGLAGRLVALRNDTNISGGAGDGSAAIDLAWSDDVTTRPNVRNILVTDLDRRAPLDLVIDTDSGLQVFRDGLAGGIFQEIGTTRRARTRLVAEDLNADGFFDLAYGDWAGRSLTIHETSTSGELGEAITIELDAEVEQIDIDDYDRDGSADVLALLLLDPAPPESPFRLLTRDPVTGEFPSSDPGTSGATTLESAAFAPGDLNGDGQLDLVLVSRSSGDVVLFDAPTSDEGFPSESPSSLISLPTPTDVILADLDRDAVLDVIISSSNELRVLLSGTPAEPVEPPPVDEPEVFEFAMSTVQATQGDLGIHSLITLDNSAEISGAVVLVTFDPDVVRNPTFDETGGVLDGAEFANESLDETNSLITFHAILDMFPPFDGPKALPGMDQELLRLRFDVAEDAPLGESPLGLPRSGGLPLSTSSVFVGAEEVIPTRVPGMVIVDAAPPPPPQESPDRLRVETVATTAGDTTFVPIYATSERAIEAFTVVATYPVEHCDAIDLTLIGSDSLGLAPELLVPSIVEEEGYFTLSIIFDMLPPFDGNVLPPGEEHVLFRAELRVHADAPVGEHPIELTDGLGTPPLDNIFSNRGMTYFPALLHGGLVIREDTGPVFLRGDANGDSNVDTTDSIFLLEWVFRDGRQPPCMDAADVNDDGVVNVTDSTWILDFVLYGTADPPPAPFPEPGVDPTPDSLDCVTPLNP